MSDPRDGEDRDAFARLRFSIIGPLLGAATLYLLEVTLHQYTEYWPIVLGIILMIIVLAAPDGLVGIFKRLRR